MTKPTTADNSIPPGTVEALTGAELARWCYAHPCLAARTIEGLRVPNDAQARVSQEAMDRAAGEAGKIEDYKAANPDWESKTRPARDVLAQAAPEGWKLVPDHPDETMWQAGRTADEHPGDSYTKVYCAMIEAAPSPPHVQIAGEVDRPKWRHLKRGSIVTEIARGFAQVAHHPIDEMTAVVIYRHDDTGQYWVRNAVEFDDGRFEAYPLPSTDGKSHDPVRTFSQCEKCWQPATCKKYGCRELSPASPHSSTHPGSGK